MDIVDCCQISYDGIGILKLTELQYHVPIWSSVILSTLEWPYLVAKSTD